MNYSLYTSLQKMLHNKAYQLLWELLIVENAYISGVN
jgi:hypothetical protein